MTNVTSLFPYAASHPHQFPSAAPQQPVTITLHRALATNANPASLRAVADWNERKSYDERRRKARARHKAQAEVLRAVADDLESMLKQASYGLREAA